MTSTGYHAPLRGWRFLLFNVVLAVGNVVLLSNVPGYTVLGPYAAGSLGGVTPSFASWATTDHLMGVALGLPLSRWFAARFGRYRAYIGGLLLYACAAFACASSETLWLFLPARIALGFIGGAVLPIGQSLALNEYPERARTFGVGLWGLLSMTPFTLGVFLGGWFAEFLGWRALFYSDIIVCLLIAGVVGALLYGRGFKRRLARFDLVGFFLLAATMYATQTILNQGNDFDWFASPILQIALVVVLVALPCFVIWELAERHPAIDLRLFAHRNYAVATFCSVVGFLVIQGLLSLFVVQLQVLNGYSSSLAGLVYLLMILTAAPLGAIMHELNKAVDVRIISLFCFIGLSVTLTWFGLFDKPASFDQISWPVVCYGFFIATFFAPLAALAMHKLSGPKLIRAAEELAMFRNAAGAFGISLMGVVQFRRLPFHQLELADHVGGRRFASLDLLSQVSDKLQTAGLSAAQARKQIGALMREESALLAMNDAFLLGAAVFVALTVLVWLAAPTKISLWRRERLERLRAEELAEVEHP
jgi:MFS transporter, DHA2 family, multidrug resistance protein